MVQSCARRCLVDVYACLLPVQARHRGGPRLSFGDVCVECLRRVLQGLVSSEDLVGLRDQLLAALEDDEANQEMMSAAAYYVSKPWVVGFKRRSTGGGVAGRLDAPTAGVRGQLL